MAASVGWCYKGNTTKVPGRIEPDRKLQVIHGALSSPVADGDSPYSRDFTRKGKAELRVFRTVARSARRRRTMHKFPEHIEQSGKARRVARDLYEGVRVRSNLNAPAHATRSMPWITETHVDFTMRLGASRTSGQLREVHAKLGAAFHRSRDRVVARTIKSAAYLLRTTERVAAEDSTRID